MASPSKAPNASPRKSPNQPPQEVDYSSSTDSFTIFSTVDLPEDFSFVERVYAALYPANPAFTSADILALPFSRRETDV